MGNGPTRVALWAMVFVLLASVLAAIPTARAASPTNYTLLGYVDQAGGASPPPVPSGVTVDLISSATHQTYTTTTQGAGGQFSFNAGNTGGTLAPGWWGLWVPPQSHISLYGCTPCAVLPTQQNPQYYWENSTSLTTQSTTANPVTITGVQLLPYNATIWGNATFHGQPVAGASVQLLAPTFNGFVLANNTTVSKATNTTVVGEFSLSVPFGTWVLETIVPGSPNSYDFKQVTVGAARVTVNPVVQGFTAWGYVNQASNPGARVAAGGNVTVFDPSSGYIYTGPIAGGYYSLGTYPAGFTGPGTQTLDVILSPVGYQTVAYSLQVSSIDPTGGPNPHISYSSPISAPASYTTTLDFTAGFGKVNVTSVASLANDSTFPDLANASVGQLWAQLALDWQHNVTFSAANLPAAESWINSSGPFFPAGQDLLTVNGTGFGQPTNYTFTPTSTCTTFCGLSSSASLGLTWHQVYNATAKVATNQKSYTVSFNFRHPTNEESFNYTVALPTGYVLNAGSQVPSSSRLVAAGPGGTWTKFTLVSLPSSSPASTATFTIVKYASVTANVNVTTANFAFSTANVLNSSHANYTVVVGVGENATFSALNSSFPAGNNGTLYKWVFGDGGTSNTSQPTTYHTYASAGSFLGTLTLTSSGGQTSTANFHVYTDDSTPTAVITTNQTQVAAGAGHYVQVNWGRTLHFNASASTDTINAQTTVPGVRSVAAWNLSTGTSSVTIANYSSGAGAKFGSNFTVTFLGAGAYLTSGNVNGTPVAFTGWQYNLTLQVWDGAGHRAVTYLTVLVNDTQKPTPVVAVQDTNGKTVSSSGVVEGANHTATLVLSASNSTDPHNGSIVSYNWTITNKGNSSVHQWINQSATSPGYKLPTKPRVTLDPQSKPYTVNLTVTDRANNTAYVTASIVVAVNTSLRPVLSVTNLTAPSTMTSGTSYTIWVNITDTIGKASTALGLQVRFYLLPPSGAGSGTTIGGSPGSVQFYNYTNNQTAATPIPTGTPGSISLSYNHTVRAVIQYNPSTSGTFDLWVNATATNEFSSDYATGGNQAHVPVTINANPIVLYEEVGAGLGVTALAIVGLVWYFRIRPRRREAATGKGTPSKPGGSSSKPSSPAKGKDGDDEDEEP